MSAALVIPQHPTLPLAQIWLGKNPRRTINEAELEQLTASVREKGVLEPIMVRPANGQGGEDGSYELVFGARRYRAAGLAGLTEIPVVVRQLDDREMLELQVIENGQRADVHPLEEAEALAELVRVHHATLDDLAAKLGKSKSYIAGRLKLAALAPGARKALSAGHLIPSVALEIAKIPVPALQEEAARECSRFDAADGPMRVATAKRIIQERYMQRLEEAQFDRTSAALVPEAGPCTTCPKRTGNQRELFSDIKSPDICTDPTCFRSKQDATWKLRVTVAKASKLPVLSDAKMKQIMQYGQVSHESGFVSADEKPSGANKTFRQLAKDAPVTIGRDPKSGNTVELIPRAAIEKAVRGKASSAEEDDAPRGSSATAPASPSKDQRAKEREDAKRAQEEEARKDAEAAQAIGALVAKAGKKQWGKKELLCVVEALNYSVQYGVADAVAARQTGSEDIKVHAAWWVAVHTLSEAELRGLVLELALGDSAIAAVVRRDESSTTGLAFKCFGVSMEAEKAQAEHDAAKKKTCEKAGCTQPVKARGYIFCELHFAAHTARAPGYVAPIAPAPKKKGGKK